MKNRYSLLLGLLLGCLLTAQAQDEKANPHYAKAQETIQASVTLAKQNQTSEKSTPLSKLEEAKKNEKASPFLSASFGKGVSFIPADRSFSMKLNFRMQALALYERTLGESHGNTSLMIRRSRIKAGGYILTPKLAYKIELGLTNRDMESTQRGDGIDNPGTILDMVLRWNFAGNWVLGFGQTKLPGNRERLVSSGNLQFVDRSIVNAKFTTDRDAGFWLSHHVGNKVVWKNTIALSSGEGKNRNIAKNPNTKEGGLSYSYRTELLPLGAFTKKGEYIEGDIYREATPKLAVAAAYNFNNNTVRNQGQLGKYFLANDMKDIHTVFVDYVFKYRGFAFMGEYAYKHAENPISIDTDAPEVKPAYVFKGNGFSSQASYVFKNNIEIAGRYSVLKPHEDIADLRKDQRDITLGISKYILGHKLKVQSDITHSTYGTEKI